MTADALRLSKTKFVSIALLLALLLIFFQLDISAGMPHPIGSNDLVFFWVAGKLLLNGESPYDGHLYLARLAELGFNVDPLSPPLVWNPPWVFSIIGFFPFLSLSVLSKAWLMLTCAIFLFCFKLSITMSRLAGARPDSGTRKIATTVFACFFPCLLCIWLGQLSPLIMLSVTLWLRQELKSQKTSRDYFLSGILLSLTSLKPHLVYLVWVQAGVRNIRQKKLTWFLGVFCGMLLLNLGPLIIRPSLYHEFIRNLQNAPLYWKNPTLTSFLISSFHIRSTFIKLLPSIICTIWVICRNYRSKACNYDYLILLIPVSILTSPYGWVYDFVLFIPCLVHYSLRSRPTAYVLILCNLMMFSSPAYEMSNYYWYPIVFTGIGVLHFIWSNNKNDIQLPVSHKKNA